VCYSVRPASRRTLASDGSNDQVTLVIPQSSPESPPSLSQSPALSRSGSKVSQEHQSLAKNQQQRTSSTGSDTSREREQTAGDIDALPTIADALATIPSEWLTYLHEDGIGWSDLGMETPSSGMLDSDLGTYPRQDSVIEKLAGGDHGMIDLTEKATPMQWNLDQIDTISNISQTNQLKPPQVASSATQGPHIDIETASPILESQTRTYDQQDHGNSESKQACIQDLAKLNEVLLREESYMEDMSAREWCGWRSRVIGQTLQHCQDLLSILRCLKIACYKDHSTKARSSDWPCSHEHQNFDDCRVNHRKPWESTNLTGGLSHSQYGSFNSSVSGNPTSTPAAPPVPTLEIPTMLSILSCYAHILQSYDKIFAPILDSVTRPRPSVPATLVGLRLDGFELDGHHSLQLECLIHVSSNLLDKLENILIGSRGQEGLLSQARGGLLAEKLFAGLTDALYDQNKQNALSCSGGKREARAKRLIREIEVALKAIDL